MYYIKLFLTKKRFNAQKMINLEKLKSLFIVTDPSEPKNKEANNAPKVDTSQLNTEPITLVNQATNNTTTFTSRLEGTIESRTYEALMAKVQNNNLEGFDYLEFKNSLHALESLPLDEATKYKTTFATASTMGLSIEKLIESAKYYLSVLEKEKEDFKKVLESQLNDKILLKENEIKDTLTQIDQKNEQIKQLAQEIQQQQTQIDTIKQEIQDRLSKINQTKANFIATYENVYGQIDHDLQKIIQYLVQKPTDPPTPTNPQ